MTTEEFWDKYTSKKILDAFDDVNNFFSKEQLPTEFLEDYDYVEIILETNGHHFDAKEFDKVLKFNKTVQQKHPQIYLEVFEYLNRDLISYHCFYQNKEEVRKALIPYLSEPVRGVDQFIKVVQKITSYQYVDLLEIIPASVYTAIDSSNDLMPGSGSFLANAKQYIELEKLYLTFLETGSFEWDRFRKGLDVFGFEFSDKFFPYVEKGLKGDTGAGLAGLFEEEDDFQYLILRSLFLVYMHKKGMPFVTSFQIFDAVINVLYKIWHHCEGSQISPLMLDYDELDENLPSGNGLFESPMP